ncbi:MAG TPA: amidohydrolase family protein [archaeon]|nr:amidohydrolase family protein [archaeon]
MFTKKVFRNLVLVMFHVVWTGLLCGSMQVPAPAQKKPVALVGGTIHPLSSPAIENGSLVFDQGKIVALGAGIGIPAGAEVVDLKGRHVYPGLIQVGSLLGLMEISWIEATSDYEEVGEINPNVRAETAINPESEHIPVTRANGIALAVVLPSGGLISGMGAAVMLDGWTWEEMTLQAPVCLVVNWPYEDTERAVGELERAFRDARAYKTARQAAGQSGVGFHETDIRWEAMIPVLDRKLPVWVEANTLQQIEAAVEWADREKIRMVLVGGADSYLAADLLKRKEIPVIVSPVLRLPQRRDAAYDDPFTLPKRLGEAGIKFCISGGSSYMGNERNLPYHAAMAAAFGLDREEALKAITLYAAEIVGIDDRVGSLEMGKDATLMVTDGDPLEITTQVERLYIQGRAVDLGNKQKALYAKYSEKYRRMGEK